MGMTASSYIVHHLQHWQWSPFGQTKTFWTFNIDTIFISILCGSLFVLLFRKAVTQSSLENPGKLQTAVEMIIEFVDDQVFSSLQKQDHNVGALALSIFMWIWIMNFMDLIPVDLLPVIASQFGVEFFRAVPTADLSMTLGMSIGVFIIILYESIHTHSLGGFLWDVCSKPFSIYAFPFNIALRVIEECAKPFSLALRLFGNMFSGEIVFFLIALSPVYFQFFFGWLWLGLHLFIITLQAFIFMILSIVYIGLARSEH